jgi:hypothetical protein
MIQIPERTVAAKHQWESCWWTTVILRTLPPFSNPREGQLPLPALAHHIQVRVGGLLLWWWANLENWNRKNVKH